MIPHGTILRIFKMIQVLAKGPKTIKQIARELGCSGRTVYRYLNLLEDIGISVDQKIKRKITVKSKWMMVFSKCPCCGNDL